MRFRERARDAVRGLLAGLAGAWTTPKEAPETFSVFDNVDHLIHGGAPLKIVDGSGGPLRVIAITPG